MGFSPDTIERLDFDFGEYGPKGTIPEPTQDRIEAFQRVAREALGGRAVTDLAGMSDDEARAVNDRLHDAVVDLCQGHPAREELEALPPRIRAGFVRWLMGELMDPTPANAGMRRSPAARNGVPSPT